MSTFDEPQSTRRSRRTLQLLVLVSSIAAVCIDFRALLSVDRVPAFRDLLPFIVPIKHFLGEHFRRGEIPFWNPWIFLGSPFIAAMHMGAFYPPSAFLLLPLPLGFNLFLLSHYLIALLGMRRFLDLRGLGWASTAVGSLTFALGGYTISLLNITKELHGAAWLPWALFFWQRWLRQSARGDLAFTAIALAMQILGGSVETMLMTVALLAGMGLEAKGASARDLSRTTGSLVVVVLAASALTAFQVLPTLEYAVESGRSGALSRSEVFHWSLEPVSLLQLLLPISARPGAGLPALGIGLEPELPQDESLYLGIPALCLALAGLFSGRQSRFWGIVLAVSLVAALGSNTAVLPFLYQYAPAVFGKLRYPEKFLLLPHVSVSVLAAYGLASLERERYPVLRAAMIAGFLVLLTAVGLQWFTLREPQAYLAWLSWMGDRPPTAIVPVAESLLRRIPHLIMLAAAFVTVLAMADRAPARKHLACLALVFLQAGDLLSVEWRSLATASWPAIVATRPVVDVEALRSRNERVFHYDDIPGPGAPQFRLAEWTYSDTDPDAQYRREWATLSGNVGMYYGVGTVAGGDGFFRRDLKVFMSRLPTLSLDGVVRALRTLGVAYFIGPTARDSSLLELVEQGREGSPFVYRVRDPSPFAYLATRLYAESSEPEAIARMAREDFDSRSEAVVAELPERWSDSVLSETGARAEIVAKEGDVIELRVTAPLERLLVVNQSVYPGWEATIDGAPAPIFRTNALVQGVRIPPGEHRVVLRYRPSGLFFGFLIAATTAAGGLVFLRRRRPGRP